MIALDLMMLAPLAISVMLLVVGNRPIARLLGLLAPLSQLVLLGILLGQADWGEALVGAISAPGASVWQLRADGLSLAMLALTALTGLLAVSASWGVSSRPHTHFALLALLQAALAAVFVADSLVLFYIGWESVLFPMFALIGGWGSSGGRRAALKYLVFSFAGGAVLLIGIIAIALSAGTDSISALTSAGGAPGAGALIFWLLATGFLVKLPAVPLHTWLPDAHTEAPTAGSIVLAGVLLKMGGYGLIRIAVPLAPEGYQASTGVLAALGMVGIVWGAACALAQTDLKRLVAYSSVAHMGFVLVAVAAGTPAALQAAVLTMFSHGLVAGMLFYLVGALYERAHTRELAAFGGLGAIVPRWSVAFVFASLASAGLPGLSGFPGEYATLLEAFRVQGWWVLVIGFGIVLAAAYNLRAVRQTVQGPAGRSSALTDLGLRESLALVVVAALIIGVGLAPRLIAVPILPVVETLAYLGGAR